MSLNKASIIMIASLLLAILGALNKIISHQEDMQAEKLRRQEYERAAESAALRRKGKQFSDMLMPQETQEPDQKQ